MVTRCSKLESLVLLELYEAEGIPKGKIKEAIDSSFGSYDNFVKGFPLWPMSSLAAVCAWLVMDGGKLKVTKTSMLITDCP